MKALARNLRNAMRARGMTVAQTAEAAGLGRDTLTRMLDTGKGNLCDLHSLGAVAEALGTPSSALLAGCDGPSAPVLEKRGRGAGSGR